MEPDPKPGSIDPVEPEEIAALVPRGRGHQFVFYGDACSGVPGAPNEATFARTNDIVRRIAPGPEFVVFAGDEIVGLTTSDTELREQWRYWFEVEMGWLDRASTPLYNTTSNHTTYDAHSERVFAEVLGHLPRNGPPDQEGLAYFVRRGDLLLVFVHTSWSGLGGEGHVETAWLSKVLDRHDDARFTFVIGHHPVFPVNGFAGEQQREINATTAPAFWQVLVDHEVIAYLCSHILAFDVQVHDGVLQIVSAGAGTPHRMPEGTEYLHAVQMAIDDAGLRYQVIDQAGRRREQLLWPLALPAVADWPEVFPTPEVESGGREGIGPVPGLLAWRLQATKPGRGTGRRQTLLSAVPEGSELPAVWIGLSGLDQRLTVILGPEPGRSPHYWFGPSFAAVETFDIQVVLHTGMGPGGVLWRLGDDAAWSSLRSASPWGPERLRWPSRWSIGSIEGQGDPCAFDGEVLAVSRTGSMETVPTPVK